MNYQQNLNDLRVGYEKSLLESQLEIQEQTFQKISRDIHDNISLSLTLAKLHLNTLETDGNEKIAATVSASVELIGKSIAELSDISRSLHSDLIVQQGLLGAIEEELRQIRLTGLFPIDYSISGNPVYMNASRELIIFRIIQEGFNNIIKHAEARQAFLQLHYADAFLHVNLSDNGKGIDRDQPAASPRAGLKNMHNRIKMLGGSMDIFSKKSQGTRLQFIIPITETRNTSI